MNKLSKELWYWAFYDFANSSYLLIYVSFLLPVFFSTVLLRRGYSLSAWGLANGLSTLFGVAAAIILGRFSDARSDKIKYFKWSIILSFVGMVLVSFAVKYFTDYLFYVYIFTNSIFIVSLAFSDSILPHISNSKNSFGQSGFAWGFGYVGGIVSLIIVIVLQKFTSEYSPAVFLSVAIFYLIFSFYCLRGLKSADFSTGRALEPAKISKKDKSQLLIGYWLISECITVIILFYTIYLSREMGFSSGSIGLILILIQLIAFPATWYGGRLADKYDPVALLGLTILFWGLALVGLLAHLGWWGLGLNIILGGAAIGNSQSYIRAQYANVIAKSESGFQFGIYSIVSEGAVFIGPIIFGFASDKLHSQAIPLICLYIFMLGGFLVIRNVSRKINLNYARITRSRNHSPRTAAETQK